MNKKYTVFEKIMAFSAAGMLLFSTPALSATVDFIENLQSLSVTGCQGTAIAASGDNEALVTGSFSGKVIIGYNQLDGGSNFSQMFIAKISSDTGEVLWLKEAGGPGVDQGNDVAVDGNGNVYVTGSFTGTIDLGGAPSVVLSNIGHEDMFIAKYDSNGHLLWASKAGSSGTASGNSLAVTPAGDVYVTGRFMKKAFSNAIASSNNTFDIFLAKFSGSNGDLVWAKRAGGNGLADEGTSVALDGNGNVFIAGRIAEGTATFDAYSLTAVNIDGFVAKYRGSDGMALWAKGVGGINSGDDIVNALVVDSSGIVYAAGEFSGTTNIGSSQLTSSGGKDVFLAGFTNAGVAEFSTVFGSTGNDRGRALAVNGTGITMLGDYEDDMTVGSTTLTSKGSKDIFVASFSLAGEPTRILRGGGSGTDEAGDIVVFPTTVNVLMAVGTFQGVADFGAGKVASLAKNGDTFITTLGDLKSATTGIAGDYTGDKRVGLSDVVGILRLLSGEK